MTPQKPPDNKGRRYHWKLKLSVIDMFGGKCGCCGVDIPDFLTIDHVNGGGNAEVKQSGKKLCSWYEARKEGIGGKFQLLCMNCNHSKHVNGGICTHKGGVRPPATRNTVRRLKIKVLTKLGGKCACCSEPIMDFLSIDHLHGGGNEHIRKVGNTGVYSEINKPNADTSPYQVLCMNCNMFKRINGGVYCTCQIPKTIPEANKKYVKTTLISPDGNLVEVENLLEFSKKNGLIIQNLRRLRAGKAKSCSGWTMPHKQD